MVLGPTLSIRTRPAVESLASLRDALSNMGDFSKDNTFHWGDHVFQHGSDFERHEYDRLDAQEIKIAVAGHGNMINRFCFGNQRWIGNNAVAEKLFILRTTGSSNSGQKMTLLRELGGLCEEITKTPGIPALEASDVRACTVPFQAAEFMS